MRIPHNERLSADIENPGPERTCILSGRSDARDALIRLALSPDGDVLPDVLARATGRGAWIAVDRDQLATAVAKGKLKGALARAFKGATLTIPADLADLTQRALIRAFTDRLGLELKAGRLLTGSERIAEQARAGRVVWLAHAADASEDGNRKLDQAWRVGEDAEGSGMAGIILPLDRAALSVALGRDNVVHLALSDAGAATRLEPLAQRLLHFLGTGSAGSDAPEAAPAAAV